MEALRSSATSITVYQSTRRNDRRLETSSASLPGPQIAHSIPFVLTVRSLKHCWHFHRKLKNVHSEMHTHEEKSRKDGVTNLEQNAQYFVAGHGPMYPLTEHCGILLPAKAIRVNSSLCTSWGIRGRKGKPLLITDLSPTWRWVITLAIQPSYPEKRDPGTHWVGLSWYRRFGEEARTSLVPARNLGTIPQQSSRRPVITLIRLLRLHNLQAYQYHYSVRRHDWNP
jgi:hypothetical protein